MEETEEQWYAGVVARSDLTGIVPIGGMGMGDQTFRCPPVADNNCGFGRLNYERWLASRMLDDLTSVGKTIGVGTATTPQLEGSRPVGRSSSSCRISRRFEAAGR